MLGGHVPFLELHRQVLYCALHGRDLDLGLRRRTLEGLLVTRLLLPRLQLIHFALQT